MTKVAVLASGGLDSCVLVYDQARDHDVVPLYIEQGLAWEQEERKALEHFVERLDHARVSMPCRPAVPRHWTVRQPLECHWRWRPSG